MKIDLNKTLFQLKKMIKFADKNTLDKGALIQLLYSIAEYADSEGLSVAKSAANHCIGKMNTNCTSSALIHDLELLHRNLQQKKEKGQVMERREAAARSSFFKRLTSKKACSHEIQRYDVIKVPTQGGFHFSVVTKVQKQHIECYPITTASEHQLSMIGCDFYKLTGSSQDGSALYLTSSRTLIPYNAAARSYVRPYQNPCEIDAAMLAFG